MNWDRWPDRDPMTPEAMARDLERHPDIKAELLADQFAGEYLAVQCERTASSTERDEREALSVDFAPFLTCHRCGRLVPQEQARYVFPDGDGAGHAHCVECWEESQQER